MRKRFERTTGNEQSGRKPTLGRDGFIYIGTDICVYVNNCESDAHERATLCVRRGGSVSFYGRTWNLFCVAFSRNASRVSDVKTRGTQKRTAKHS